MGYTASYTYKLVDKYSGPLKNIIKAQDKFIKQMSAMQRGAFGTSNSIRNSFEKINNSVKSTILVKSNINDLQRFKTSHSNFVDDFVNETKRYKKAIYERLDLIKTGYKLKRFGRGFYNFAGATMMFGTGYLAGNVYRKVLEIELAFNQLKAFSSATQEQMLLLKEQAKNLGATTIFTISQVATAQGEYAKKGLKVNDILAITPELLKFAAASQMELAEAAQVTTGVLNAYQKPLTFINQLSDELAYTAANTATNIKELASAFEQVAPTAHASGVSIEMTTAMLGLMAQKNIRASKAGTYLMNMMVQLQKLSKRDQLILAKYGFKYSDIFTKAGLVKDLSWFLDEIEKRKMLPGDIATIFNIRGSKAVQVLKGLGSEIRKFVKQLDQSTGSTKKMSATITEGVIGAHYRFKSAVEAINYAMALFFLPTLTDVMNHISKLLFYLHKINPVLLKFIATVFLGFTAFGLIIVPLGMLAAALGSLLIVLGTAAAPFIIIIGSIASLIFMLKKWADYNHPVLNTLNMLLQTTSSVQWGLGNNKFAIFIHSIGNYLGIFINLLAIVLNILDIVSVSFISTGEAVWHFLNLDFKKAFSSLHEGGAIILQDLKNIKTAQEDAFKHMKGAVGKGEYSWGGTFTKSNPDLWMIRHKEEKERKRELIIKVEAEQGTKAKIVNKHNLGPNFQLYSHGM